MNIKEKIKLAKFAEKQGWIDKKDWKTTKILNSKYRRQVQNKAIGNAIRDSGDVITKFFKSIFG